MTEKILLAVKEFLQYYKVPLWRDASVKLNFFAIYFSLQVMENAIGNLSEPTTSHTPSTGEIV